MRRLKIVVYLGIVLTYLTSASAVMALSYGQYTIQQASNERFVDAHEYSGEDFRLVTRPAQNNETQRWLVTPLGSDRYRIMQVSSQRYVDAHEIESQDYRLVTRTYQNNDTQVWVIKYLGGGAYTIQQASNNRYMDAYESSSNDYRLVTRPKQNNNTQRWMIKPAPKITTLQLTNNQSGQWLKASGQHFSPNSQVSVYYENPRYGDQFVQVSITTNSSGSFDYDQMNYSSGINCSWYRMHNTPEYWNSTLRFEDSQGKTVRYTTGQLSPCSWLP